jgi:hypothetical protein
MESLNCSQPDQRLGVRSDAWARLGVGVSCGGTEGGPAGRRAGRVPSPVAGEVQAGGGAAPRAWLGETPGQEKKLTGSHGQEVV